MVFGSAPSMCLRRASRRYSSPGSLLLKVNDDLCPWNEEPIISTSGKHGRGECKRTQRRRHRVILVWP